MFLNKVKLYFLFKAIVGLLLTKPCHAADSRAVATQTGVQIDLTICSPHIVKGKHHDDYIATTPDGFWVQFKSPQKLSAHNCYQVVGEIENNNDKQCLHISAAAIQPVATVK